MSSPRERLQHTIHAWAEIHSDAHAAALNAEVDAVCSTVDRLERHADRQALEIDAHRTAISQLQKQPIGSAPDVINALADLCEAYRGLAGIGGAWDEPLVRAEAAVIAARKSGLATDAPADRMAEAQARAIDRSEKTGGSA